MCSILMNWSNDVFLLVVYLWLWESNRLIIFECWRLLSFIWLGHFGMLFNNPTWIHNTSGCFPPKKSDKWNNSYHYKIQSGNVRRFVLKLFPTGSFREFSFPLQIKSTILASTLTISVDSAEHEKQTGRFTSKFD